MVILVNKDTGELTHQLDNAFPLRLRTSDRIEVFEKITRKHSVYENKTGSYKKYTRDIQTVLENASVFGNLDDMDEVMFEGEAKVEYTEVEETNMVKHPLNEGNYTLSTLEDIMEQECLNMLNDSRYQKAVTGILSDVRIIGSSFLTLTDFKAVIGREQKIIMDIKELTHTIVNQFEIYNISKEARVFFNNVEATFDTEKCCFVGRIDTAIPEAVLEIRNENIDVVVASYPYILC